MHSNRLFLLDCQPIVKLIYYNVNRVGRLTFYYSYTPRNLTILLLYNDIFRSCSQDVESPFKLYEVVASQRYRKDNTYGDTNDYKTS